MRLGGFLNSVNLIFQHSLSFLVLYPVALLAFLAFLSKWIHIPEDTLIQLKTRAFGGLFSLWLIWHCAYIKYGTRLLGFWLIVSPFRQLASISEALKETCDESTLSIIALDLFFFIWWYLLNFKMRKVNKSIRERKKVQPEQVTS